MALLGAEHLEWGKAWSIPPALGAAGIWWFAHVAHGAGAGRAGILLRGWNSAQVKRVQGQTRSPQRAGSEDALPIPSSHCQGGIREFQARKGSRLPACTLFFPGAVFCAGKAASDAFRACQHHPINCCIFLIPPLKTCKLSSERASLRAACSQQ